jgi:ribonuclease P protein component
MRRSPSERPEAFVPANQVRKACSGSPAWTTSRIRDQSSEAVSSMDTRVKRKGPYRTGSSLLDDTGTTTPGGAPRRLPGPEDQERMPGFGGWQPIPGLWKSQSWPVRWLTNPWSRRGFGVDPGPGPLVPLKANFRAPTSLGWVICHDADVQAAEPEAEEQARIPGTNADQGGPKDPQPAPPEGAAASGGERRFEVGPVSLARPGAGAPGNSRLPPSSRISEAKDIRELLRRGWRKKTSHLDVFFLSSERPAPRLGLVVPRYGRRVVDRNRVKRRLREVGRQEILSRLRASGVSLDLLIRARREAYGVGYRELRKELTEMIEELCSGPSSWR